MMILQLKTNFMSICHCFELLWEILCGRCGPKRGADNKQGAGVLLAGQGSGGGTTQDTWSATTTWEGAQLELVSSLARVLNSKFEWEQQREQNSAAAPKTNPMRIANEQSPRIFVPKIHFVNWKPLKVILWKALSHETCNMTIDIGIRHGAPTLEGALWSSSLFFFFFFFEVLCFTSGNNFRSSSQLVSLCSVLFCSVLF